MTKQTDYIMGESVQLWVGTGKTAHTVACATSMSLQIQADSVDVANKDTGAWGATKRGKVTWNTTQTNQFAVADYKELMDYFIAGTPVLCIFGLVDGTVATSAPDTMGRIVPEAGWTPSTGVTDADNYYYGYATITSVSLKADQGSVATYDIQLNGTGALKNGLPEGQTYTKAPMDTAN